jgi:sec-independent protein translocase protein TatB
MFEIGGLELLVIAVVALVVIGPKDLPVAIRTIRTWMSRARDLAREFQSGLDEIAREAKLDDVKREIDQATRPEALVSDFKRDIEHSIDPGGKIADSLRQEAEDLRLSKDWYSPDAIQGPVVVEDKPELLGGVEEPPPALPPAVPPEPARVSADAPPTRREG